MTPAEATILLGGIAAFDNRKPDENAAKMWAHALGGLRLEDCAQAVTQHFATSTEYLMPVHIRRLVKVMRAKRITAAGDLTPPPGLGVIETHRWTAQARSRIGDGEDPVQVQGDYGELKPRHLPDLRALMPGPSDA